MKWIAAMGCLVMAACVSGSAQTGDPIPLWPDGAPGALGSSTNDVPTLTPYAPDASKATGTAVVICPGGGYWGLAPHEGRDYALFLNQHGVTCFVLKYRLAQHGYKHPAMLQDVNRAVKVVRSIAAKWKLDPAKVGVMGSSAGGHLTSTAVTHFDLGNSKSSDPVEWHSSRPDFGILCYPVISMGEFTHSGSKRNLLGEQPTADLVWKLSSELQVTPQTPPCFVWHTQEDAAVPVEGALQFVAALQRAHVPCDFHIYQKGRHGIGLNTSAPEFKNPHPWARDLVFWMSENGWVR